MNDAELLAEMQKQYKYATLETCMLINGEVRQRCRACGVRPLPKQSVSVLWCDPCLDECIDSGEPGEVFIARKRAERAANEKD